VTRRRPGRRRQGDAPTPAALSPHCPVCRRADTESFFDDGTRRYWRCPSCTARFLDPQQRPGREAERAHYAHHENEIHDPGYRRFLAKLADPLLARLAPASAGLDYGCGPGPALAAMLEEAGHHVARYDPAFAPDQSVLARQYDFITVSETAEHFHQPAEEFAQLDGMLTPGGWLGVMTCFQTDDSRFADWHYRRDPTHVVFYRAETLRHIARAHGWRCEIPIKDVALMHKPAAAAPAAAPA